MKNNTIKKGFILFIIFSIHFLRCKEALPTRIVPENTIEISEIMTETASFPDGSPFLNIIIKCKNLYHKTFQAYVELGGYVHIWRAVNPSIEKYISVDNANIMAPTRIHGRLMTVDPGEYFYLNIIWDLYLDNSIWVVDLLNFETSNSSGQFIFSKPETFYIEAEISLFNETGVFSYDATPISLVAWKKGEVETKDPDPGS